MNDEKKGGGASRRRKEAYAAYEFARCATQSFRMIRFMSGLRGQAKKV